MEQSRESRADRRWDLVLRGGTVVDGSGGPSFAADVAVRDGTIVAVGEVDGGATREIDVSGLHVVPGFVDIHTHYDGQASWDSDLAPSCFQGVTSIAFGNCGVGFAPAKAAQRAWLIDLLEGVEDIPGTALTEGLTWEWTSFPEFLDALARRHYKLDVGAHVPHAPLRCFVMGDAGADPGAVPTPAQCEEMARLTAAAIDQGALGFSTSRTMVHRTRAGQVIGTFRAPEEELLTIAEAMGRAGKGVIQLISDAYLLPDLDFAEAEFALIERIARTSGRPVSLTVQQVPTVPDRWLWMYDRIARMRAAGLDVKAQVAARGIGAIIGLRTSANPLKFTASWQELGGLPIARLKARMADPALRRRLAQELRNPAVDHPFAKVMADSYERMFRMAAPVDYEPDPDSSIGAEARRLGIDPWEHFCAVLLEQDGERLLYTPSLNYAHGNLDDVHGMMTAEFALFGLSDGGAHCASICDASFPVTAVGFWPKGSRSGLRIPLEQVVEGYTRRNAMQVGWLDRGLVAPGHIADLNILDIDALALEVPQPTYDLPAGGMRILQKARGIRMTIKSGEVTFADGERTDALPGRLVRGDRIAAPPEAAAA